MSLLFKQLLGSGTLALAAIAVGADAFCSSGPTSTRRYWKGKSYNCGQITKKIGTGDCLAPVTLGGGMDGTVKMSRQYLQHEFRGCCNGYHYPCRNDGSLTSSTQDYCLRDGTCYPVFSFRGQYMPCYEHKESSAFCVGCWKYDTQGCRSPNQCEPFGRWNYAAQNCGRLSCSQAKPEDCTTRESCSSTGGGTWRCKDGQCSCRRCSDADPEACRYESECRSATMRHWSCADGDCTCRKCCVEGCTNGHWSFCQKETCMPTQRAPDVKFIYKSMMVKDLSNRDVWRNVGTCSRCLVTSWGVRYTQGCMTKRECHTYKEFRWQCREEVGPDCCATCERRSVQNCRSHTLCKDHGGLWCEARQECDPFGRAKPCKERPPLQCKHTGKSILQQIERKGYKPRRCTDTDRIGRAREMLMGSTENSMGHVRNRFAVADDD